MDIVVQRCAGLDVHKDTVVACVRVPGVGRQREEHIATFATTTVQLLALRDWLLACGVTLVGMESTGVYWKPVFYMLEDAMECWVLNARHLRNVPGRKTDVSDAVWIAGLVEHGLVRPSFVPPKPIRELRNLTRYRRSQIEERTREAQRLDKVLQDAGIKLSSVASRVLGVSGRAMLEALVAGTRDPEVLAELARGTLRKKIPQLQDALAGRFGPHHGLLVGQILAKLDFLDEAIANLSAEIDRVIAPYLWGDSLSRGPVRYCAVPALGSRRATARSRGQRRRPRGRPWTAAKRRPLTPARTGAPWAWEQERGSYMTITRWSSEAGGCGKGPPGTQPYLGARRGCSGDTMRDGVTHGRACGRSIFRGCPGRVPPAAGA
jgi:transposase